MRVHSPRKSDSKKTLRVLIIALVVIGVGMLAPRVMTWLGTTLMMPVHAVNVWFENSSAFLPSYLRDRNDLVQTIRKLEDDLVLASGTNLTLQQLMEENQRLRALLQAEARPRIAAAVIARPNDLPYDILQIDRGSDDGVVIGAPVYIGSIQVIGFVSEVASNYAFVEMLTTPGFEATGFIAGPNVIATIEGYGGGAARVKVPQGITMTIGDLVHLPSMESGVFGRISHIENRPSQPEQYGYIAPDISIQSIHTVSVATETLTKRTPADIEASVAALIREQILIEESNGEIVASSTATTTATTTQNEL